MTYKEMFDNVKRRCSITGESEWDADIRQYLNDAQNDIASRYFWPFLESSETVTTTSGTSTYALANQATVKDIRDTTNLITLRPIDILDFDRYFQNPVSTGISSLYAIVGQTKASDSVPGTQNVYLYPVPAGTYSLSVREYADMADMENDTDVSPVPPRFHIALVHYACQAFFSSRGDLRSNEHDTRYENMVVSMAEQLDATPIDMVQVMRNESEAYDPRMLQYPPFYPRP